MTPAVIGMLVFACTFGGALVGLWLRAALPDHHLSNDSKDTVKVGIGLIATMTALVLGLVTASAKSSFDALNTAVKHTAADVLALDRTLARYGPESKAVREALAHVIAQRLEMTWPQHSSHVARQDHLEVTHSGEELVERLRGLAPQHEHQRWLQAHAVALSEALLMAAERTPGLLKNPAPFVLQQTLSNFAVTYELNVSCDNAQAMLALYTDLHRHILDLFNEYGVQIMTPAYRSDPAVPKVVPKERWFTAPAQPARDGA